jgi:hypothetical protein
MGRKSDTPPRSRPAATCALIYISVPRRLALMKVMFRREAWL